MYFAKYVRENIVRSIGDKFHEPLKTHKLSLNIFVRPNVQTFSTPQMTFGQTWLLLLNIRRTVLRPLLSRYMTGYFLGVWISILHCNVVFKLISKIVFKEQSICRLKKTRTTNKQLCEAYLCLKCLALNKRFVQFGTELVQ